MIKLSPRLTTLALLAAILLAFGLRVYRLGAQGIWGDEAFSIATARLPLDRIIAAGTDTHPPLFHSLLHFWIIAVGASEFAARYPALIAGVLLIPVTYVLGRRLLGSPAALVAAGLIAASPFAVYYSQEARMYAQAVLFGALSAYFTIQLWDRSQRAVPLTRAILPWAAGYLSTTLAGMYSHYYVFFVIAAENLSALWLWHRRRSWLTAWIGLQALLAACYLPWVIAQTGYLLNQAAGSRPEALNPGTLIGIGGDALRAFSVGVTAPASLEWGVYVGVTLAVFGAGVIVWRRDRVAKYWGFLLAYLILQLALAWLVGPIMRFFHVRFLLLALPAYALIAAAGVTWLLDRKVWPVAAGLLALTAAADWLSLSHGYFDPAFAKSGYREIMGSIHTQAAPGDALFLLNPEQDALFAYYGDPALPAYWFPPPAGWDAPKTQKQLAQVAGGDKRIWLVAFGNAQDWDPGNRLQRWLNEHAFRASHTGLVDTELDLYVIGEVEPGTPYSASFGGLIDLMGYGLSSQTLSAGDVLQIALKWKALAKMDRDYTIFTHLIDKEGHIIGQFDGQPLGGAHSTSAWQPGEESTDRFGIAIAPGTPPGQYQLEVGWYDLATLKRIPVAGGQGAQPADRVILAQIEIRP